MNPLLTVLVFATANIKGYPAMEQKMVRADLVRVRRRSPHVLATQEMWKWRYRRALRRIFRGWRHQAQFNTSTALSVSGGVFEVVRKYSFPLHEGYPKERLDARRAQVIVTRLHAIDVTVTFICVHPGPKRVAEDHRDLWPTANENVMAVVREQQRLGRMLVVLGDTNQHGRIYGDDALYLIDPDEIDKMACFDSKTHEWARVDGEADLEGFTDHTMYVRRAGIRRKAA